MHLWGSQNKLQTWPSPPTFKGRALFLLLYCCTTMAGPQASGLFSCLVFLVCRLWWQSPGPQAGTASLLLLWGGCLLSVSGERETHLSVVEDATRTVWQAWHSHTCPRKKCTSLSHEKGLEAQPWCAEGQLCRVINYPFFLIADYWKSTTSAQKGVGK